MSAASAVSLEWAIRYEITRLIASSPSGGEVALVDAQEFRGGLYERVDIDHQFCLCFPVVMRADYNSTSVAALCRE